MTPATMRHKAGAVTCVSVVLSLVIGGLLGFWIAGRTDTAFVYGIIVEGMAGLLSVTVAVVIFRIQALENRNQALEQSTLTFVFEVSRNTYPQWLPILESNIESGAIANVYYRNRRVTVSPSDEAAQRNLIVDRDNQQSRLMQNLNCHRRTIQTIEDVKDLFRFGVPLLIAPIVVSLVMLMLAPFPVGLTSFPLPICVLLSVSGVVVLVWVSWQSLKSIDGSSPARQTAVPPCSPATPLKAG